MGRGTSQGLLTMYSFRMWLLRTLERYGMPTSFMYMSTDLVASELPRKITSGFAVK